MIVDDGVENAHETSEPQEGNEPACSPVQPGLYPVLCVLVLKYILGAAEAVVEEQQLERDFRNDGKIGQYRSGLRTSSPDSVL